jgi:hypothetical protein
MSCAFLFLILTPQSSDLASNLRTSVGTIAVCWS